MWQLDIQSCVQTIVGHRHQVWSIDISADHRRLVTGSADAELRLFDLTEAGNPNGVVTLGKIRRQSKERVVQIRYNKEGTKIGCVAADKMVEIFKVRSEAEVKPP